MYLPWSGPLLHEPQSRSGRCTMPLLPALDSIQAERRLQEKWKDVLGTKTSLLPTEDITGAIYTGRTTRLADCRYARHRHARTKGQRKSTRLPHTPIRAGTCAPHRIPRSLLTAFSNREATAAREGIFLETGSCRSLVGNITRSFFSISFAGPRRAISSPVTQGAF